MAAEKYLIERNKLIQINIPSLSGYYYTTLLNARVI